MTTNLDFTLLTKDQVVGENQLKIFEIYGTKCAITDFVRALGGTSDWTQYTKEGRNLKNRAGAWRLKDFNPEVLIELCTKSITSAGICKQTSIAKRDIGIRPAIPYSQIKNKITNEHCIYGLKEVEFGEYPGNIENEAISKILEENYYNKTLIKTGKTYTTDSIDDYFRGIPFKPRKFEEYEYKGSKYIRFVGEFMNHGYTLSDGRTISSPNGYWIKVEPIKWLVDEENDIAISKKILVSGIQFNLHSNITTFEDTNIKKYLDDYFAKDIISSIAKTKLEKIELSKEEKRDHLISLAVTKKEYQKIKNFIICLNPEYEIEFENNQNQEYNKVKKIK